MLKKKKIQKSMFIMSGKKKYKIFMGIKIYTIKITNIYRNTILIK